MRSFWGVQAVSEILKKSSERIYGKFLREGK